MTFEDGSYRREPPHEFLLLSMSGPQLRSLCDIRRRESRVGMPRSGDLAIQRRHDVIRSQEISEYVRFGFPLSGLSKSARQSGDFDDLRKPGWLPTAIVVNILTAEDQREGNSVATKDLIEVETTSAGAILRVPAGSDSKDWAPEKLAPIEVIDGQHRLWGFRAR